MPAGSNGPASLLDEVGSTTNAPPEGTTKARLVPPSLAGTSATSAVSTPVCAGFEKTCDPPSFRSTLTAPLDVPTFVTKAKSGKRAELAPVAAVYGTVSRVPGGCPWSKRAGIRSTTLLPCTAEPLIR